MFEIARWKDTGGLILKGASVDESQMLLDDHAIKSQAMMSSPFAKPFHERISMWTAKLNKMQNIFDQWLNCQVRDLPCARFQACSGLQVDGQLEEARAEGA